LRTPFFFRFSCRLLSPAGSKPRIVVNGKNYFDPDSDSEMAAYSALANTLNPDFPADVPVRITVQTPAVSSIAPFRGKGLVALPP